MHRNTSYDHTKTPPPQLTATFIPGDDDNYHMPVISPIPQRSMPEVPDQMQQNLARLELDSVNIDPASHSNKNDQRGISGRGHQSQPSNPQNLYAPSQVPLAGQPGAKHSPRPSPRASPNLKPQADLDGPSQGALAPEPFFPHIKNPPPNVPARAEAVEQILESARQGVLTSNDAELQVTWAQDTLAYVHVANENNARLAEAGMGRSRTPRIEHQLRVDAVQIISFLANQHHPKAEFLQGTWLEFGRFGFDVDKPQAYRCFSTAARNGYGRAEYRIGMQFEETKELDKALRHYNLGIQATDAASYYRMGMVYLLGQIGQPQDMQRGIDYIKFSADTADENAPQGAYVYGMLLAKELPQVLVPDELLPRDATQAKYYLEKAAYLGFSQAQTRLGSAYELQQLNCDFDPVYSLHYNLLAARQGEPEAEMAISKWFLSGYDGMFPKNEALAYEYALRAAVSGFPTAEFAMGYYNEVGIHVPTNLAEAKVWYSKAAAHGNQDAKGRIVGISRSKTLSRKDHDNMALAKIKSVRGRPTAAQQQKLSMPQIDAYRQPSPAPPNAQPSGNPAFDAYRREQYSVPPQAPPNGSHLTPSDPRLGPYGYNPMSGGQGSQTPSGRPTSTVYAQSRPLSASPAGVYAHRQSSLPQGYRMSSQGIPTGISPRPSPQPSPQLSPNPAASPGHGPGQQIPLNANRPDPSPRMSSAPSEPPKPSYTADFGYSAPVEIRSSYRQRMTSGGPVAGNPSPNPGNTVPTRKPISGGPPSQASSQPSKVESSHPQPKPFAKLQDGPSSTPPPKSTTAPSAGKKPGKGPSTFAEMGIPQHKQDSDCVVM